MENYLLTFIGIIVSVILFLLSYKQTIGAKKERIRSANLEIEKILVRRIVLEDFTPLIQDIGRLIEGKARDYRVGNNELLSESQILNTIYTRILETDFITQEQREKIINRINSAILKSEDVSVEESDIINLPSSRQKAMTKSILPIILGIVASILGTFLSFFPELRNYKSGQSVLEIISLIVGTLAISFAVTMVFYIFKKYKDSTDENSKISSIEKYILFEKKIEDLIVKNGYRIIKSGDIYYDFLIEKYNNKYIIEIKNWSRPIPLTVIQKIAFKMNELAKAESAKKAIIVTPSSINIPKDLMNYEFVSIVNIKELRNYLIHSQKPV
ncbi:MAG: restriction endonuclease [Melioribacteraceae bacterium]